MMYVLSTIMINYTATNSTDKEQESINSIFNNPIQCYYIIYLSLNINDTGTYIMTSANAAGNIIATLTFNHLLYNLIT